MTNELVYALVGNHVVNARPAARQNDHIVVLIGLEVFAEHLVGLDSDFVSTAYLFAGNADRVNMESAAAQYVQNFDRFAFFKTGRKHHHHFCGIGGQG